VVTSALNAPVRALKSARAAETTAGAATGARPRDVSALLDRVRKRRLVYLLRARRHGGVRPRADAARLRHRGDLLQRNCSHVRGGHRPLPGSGRLGELRAPRLQRARLLRGRRSSSRTTSRSSGRRSSRTRGTSSAGRSSSSSSSG